MNKYTELIEDRPGETRRIFYADELVDTITQLVLYVAVFVVGGLLGYEHGRQESQADAFMRGVDTLLQLCPAIF